VFYFPRINKIYSKDEFYDYSTGFKTLLPNAKEKTYFTFTSKSTEYPEEKLQLLKITYMANAGGPERVLENPSWGKDYGGSGIFTDRDPYKKVLVSDKDRSRILNYSDITPGRLYFDPKVLWFDQQNILIKFNVTAAENSAQKLQCLSTNGEIKWTLALPKDFYGSFTKYNKGYLGVSYQNILLVSEDGKVIKQFTINK
jgi:hypothetical protein